MTHTSTEQPEALRLAECLEKHVWQATPLRLSKVVELSADELRRLHARVQELEASNANLKGALENIASGEITRSHCVGPHCTEEIGVATADEMANRAAGALDWDERRGITQEKQP